MDAGNAITASEAGEQGPGYGLISCSYGVDWWGIDMVAMGAGCGVLQGATVVWCEGGDMACRGQRPLLRMPLLL